MSAVRHCYAEYRGKECSRLRDVLFGGHHRESPRMGRGKCVFSKMGGVVFRSPAT